MNNAINSGLFVRLANNLNSATSAAARSLERLSAGKRVLAAKDGGADLARISRLSSQYRGITQAIVNVNETNSLAETADSSLDGLLQTAYSLRELAQKASDSSLTSDERDLIVEEASALIDDFDTIVSDTEYNNIALLDNSFGSKWIQTGTNRSEGFYFSIGDARSSTLGKLAIYSGSQGSISTAITSQVTINGTTIDSSVSDEVSSSGGSYSALAIATAINETSGTTGVEAEALTTKRTLYTDFAGATNYSGTFSSGQFQINDVSITGTIASASAVVTAINAASSTTGVTATLSGTDIILSADDGRNIEIYFSSGGLTNNVYDAFNLSTNYTVLTNYATLSQGNNSTHVGAIQIWSSSAITIAGTSPSAALGIASGTKNLVSGTALESIDLSDTTTTDNALKTLDAVIVQISTLRSDIGAVHSRLDARASYLLDSQIATYDAKSSLQDVDFVLETTDLVVAQLLQDSSLAALSQANLSMAKVSRLLENL